MTTSEIGYGSEIATVAAAMVRHVLPAASSLRLEVRADDRAGIWLHLTYPAPGPGSAPASRPAVGELSLINSAAQSWGHYGDAYWHTLWVLLPLPVPLRLGPLEARAAEGTTHAGETAV